MDDGGGDGRHRTGEFDVVAEFADDDDIAGPEELAFDGGEGVIGFQVVAEAPIVIDPDAVSGGDGVELRGEGYNIFALGPEGFGRRFLVEHHLNAAAASRAKPSDICYVNNLSDPNRPRLLLLPAGVARGLKRDVQRLIEEIAEGQHGTPGHRAKARGAGSSR